MKQLSKKKFATEKEAFHYLQKKVGRLPVLVKETSKKWFFNFSLLADALEIAKGENISWRAFLNTFRKENPQLSYREAQQQASPLYQAQKGE